MTINGNTDSSLTNITTRDGTPRPLPRVWKDAIRETMAADIARTVATHNGDGLEGAALPVYRAASVLYAGSKPTNLSRRVAGGRTIGEVLTAAGILAA